MQVDGNGAVERRIAGAFKAAADTTGTSFDYLLNTSRRESDHRPDLAASGSSAKGLFQFVDQTWFELVRREGPSVGLERLADEIVSDGKGGWTVENPTERAKILSLRTDPLVSAVMAGRFTQDNARRLGDALGRAPTDGELYAAHVLGPAGATRLFRLAANEPGTAAAVAFPKAAAANPGLFYESGGRARTVGDLFARLTRMPETDGDATTARIAAVHRSLSATTSKTDQATVALLLRAQAAALVGQEKVGAAATAATAALPTAADRALTRATLAETAIPGAPDVVEAGHLDGWRARMSRDAFAGLMRDDGAGGGLGAAFASTRVLPGVSGAALAAAAASAAGTPGGIARVDTAAPMSLAAATPPPAVVALENVAPERPSRFAVAAAYGAPAAPLPTVDAARGETRPSRLLFEQWNGPSEAALAAGVVRVRTTTVTPARADAAPAPTFTAEAPAAAATRRAGPRRRVAPLDLLALARASAADRGGADE